MSRSIATSACRLATSRIDRGGGERASAELVAHQAVLAGDVAVDRELVPFLGVTDIVDRDVVVLAPEERHGVELLAQAQHVERRGLSLALGDHPVLDADRLAAVRVGPARDVAGGEDGRRAGLQKRVDRDPAIDREPRLLGELEPRPHAHAHDHEIGLERAAALQLDLLAVDGGRPCPRDGRSTPCSSCRARTKSPIAGPRMRSIGRFSGATTWTSIRGRAARPRPPGR